MDEQIFKILQYVIYIIVFIIARYLIPIVKEKAENSRYKNILLYIEKAINAAESKYINIAKSGENKKSYVLKETTQYLNKKGIKISADQLDLLIEAVFMELDGFTVNKKKQS